MTTSRELVSDLIRGGGAERVGLVDSPWADTIAAWVEQGYPTRMAPKQVGEQRWRRSDGRWVDVEVAGEYEEPVPPWEHFGYDLVGVGPWFDIMPWRDYDELVDETDAWDVRRYGAGAALKYWKHKSGTPEHMDFRMVRREIWERDYRQHVLELDEERVDLKELRKNLAKAKPKPFDVILVWKLSRFARNREDSIIYKSLLRKRGIQIVSINEPVDDSPAGALFEGMIEVIDEFYSANLSQEARRGLRETVSRGFFPGGTTPTGYKLVEVTNGRAKRKTLALDNEYAPIVKRVFDLCLAGNGAK